MNSFGIAMLNVVSIFVMGALLGAMIVNYQATNTYREMQMDLNEQLRLRDVDRGSMYVR